MRPLLVAGALCGLAACTPKGASVDQLMSRATFDFDCPRPELQIHELGDMARGVTGCGRRLTYVEVCENRVDGMHCTWVINGPQWQYGPSANKRPPTPERAFYYSAPPPSPVGPMGVPTAGVPGQPAPIGPPPAPPTAAPASPPPAAAPPAEPPAPAAPPAPQPDGKTDPAVPF